MPGEAVSGQQQLAVMPPIEQLKVLLEDSVFKTN